MPSINILCSSALPFVPTKFQIDAEEHDTVLVAKRRLCLKLVQLQREGSQETSTESYNREQDHVGNTDNLKLIFGGKILPDTNELPNLAATNPTFHLHLLPISLDKKLSIIERFRRGSTGKSEAAVPESSTSSAVEPQMYNVRLFSNQAVSTEHYNVEQQSLNLDGEQTVGDLKDLLIKSQGKDTAVKSLDLAIQRKFVVFNSKGQDFSEDDMKVKEINNFGRPPHSQGTNVVIFYRFVLGEFEQYQVEEKEEESKFPFEEDNRQEGMDRCFDQIDHYNHDAPLEFDRGTPVATVSSHSKALAGAFTAQLNLDEEKGKEIAEDGDGDVVMEEEEEVEEVPVPTPTIKHLFIKDSTLGDFHLNPADVMTGTTGDSGWVAISPREMTRLKRLYREFGNPESEVKRRKSGEFTRSPGGGAVTTSRDIGSSSTSGTSGTSNASSSRSPSNSVSNQPSTASASSSNPPPHSPPAHTDAHNHVHFGTTDTANSTDTEADVQRSTQPTEASHTSATPASDQYRQFQQFLRWADTQHQENAEPAEFDYRQFQQFLQWGQVQPPVQQPLVDVSFHLRISPPPWNIRQRIRDMVPPRDQLRERAVVAIRQLGDVLVFLLQLFVFYIMVLGRINNDYMFYASCGMTVIIFVGYRFRHHLERFRPASFHVGSEELSRVAQIFPAVNYDQEETVGGNNEAVREALENPDHRHARGVRIGAAFFGSMIPAVHSRWLADNRQRRVQLDATIRQQERGNEEEEGEGEDNNRAERNE